MTRNESYDIRGNSVEELHRSMVQNAPRFGGSTPWYGYHRWNIQWQYAYASTPTGCELRDIIVRLNTEIVTPKWTPPADAAAELVEAWGSFRESLETHEYGHQVVARRAAADVVRTLRNLRPMDCYDIQRRANDAATRVVDKANAANAKYDIDTRHGLSQGAVWPPRSRPVAQSGR